MSHMQILDPTGHTSVKWDADVPAEVEAARKVFTEMTAKGYHAFRAGKNGARMREFDPSAEKVVLVPHLVGG
jgi:hypothetical protein